MAAAASCCLKRSPPTPASAIPTSSTKCNQIAWLGNENFRKKCVVGMACMIVGVQMSSELVSGQNLAIAQHMQPVVESKEKSGSRWSDRRTCPSWNQNSLETIVPENLPRPSARRRWEAVGLSKIAPLTVRRSNNCFSM